VENQHDQGSRLTFNNANLEFRHLEKDRNDHRFLKYKIIICAEQIDVPKIDEWSILGIATALSGKRQDGDSELACPTPTLKCAYYSI